MEAPQSHPVPVSSDGGTTTAPSSSHDKPLSRKEKKKLKQEEKKRQQAMIQQQLIQQQQQQQQPQLQLQPQSVVVVNEFNEISSTSPSHHVNLPADGVEKDTHSHSHSHAHTPVVKKSHHEREEEEEKEEEEEDEEEHEEREEEEDKHKEKVMKKKHDREHEEEGGAADHAPKPLPKVPGPLEEEEKYQYPVVKIDLSGHRKDYGLGVQPPPEVPSDLSYAPASHHRVDDTPGHTRPNKHHTADTNNNNNNNHSEMTKEKSEKEGSKISKEGSSAKPSLISTNDWEVHVLPHSDITKLVPGKLWMVEGLISRGNSLHRNMVIYKTNQGTLWIHSVIACHQDVMAKIEQLGPIDTIIIPNLDHIIDLHVFQLRYPQAKYIAPRNIIHKLIFGGHRVDGAAEDYLEPTYGIRAITPDGTKGKELVYELPLGNMTTGLVFGDLLANVNNVGLFKRFLYGNSFECPRHIQWNIIKSRGKFKQWLQNMAEPPASSTSAPTEPSLKIICVSHGKPITEKAVDMLKDVARRF